MDITPFEAWYGFKPKVKHLCVFGSICYALVPKEKRTKLDSHSMKCMMIGYSDEKKGYRLLSNGKFVVSWDVIFDETKVNMLLRLKGFLISWNKKWIRRKTG
jgi:hypothetical protein